MRHTGIFLVTGLLLLISACATPGPAACPCDPPSGQAYNNLSDNTGNSADGATSSLLGVGVASEREAGANSSSFLTSSGTLTHSNKAISFSVGEGYTFANTTGPSQRNSAVYNGEDTDTYSVTVTYDYVRAYTMEYSDAADVGYEFLGVHGIATQETDVQDAASRNVMANYTGDAIIDIDLSDVTVARIMGDSTVSADFAGNTVNVNMEGFADNSIITAIDISGMAIVGNSFSGGTITVEGIASGLANSATRDSTGYFYGWDDSDGAPAEVGGTVVLVEDDDNYLYATFLGRK